jgi:hypothetical protein
VTATARGQTTVSTEEYRVAVSRRIEADAGRIFAVLADPQRHTELDGSGMLRGALTDGVVSGVGDVFVLKMYFEPLGGDYEMANHVVEFEANRRIVWRPQRNDIDQPSWEQLWGYQLSPDGEEATVVTEIFDCAGWPGDKEADLDNGRMWIEAMTTTLERLDEVVTGQPSDGPAAA